MKSKSKFIFIVGFMASGKSTFGKRLAKELEYIHLDTDKYIEDKTGISIEGIFKLVGEKRFRKIEKKALIEILQKEGSYVISTGGGMSCKQRNLSKMLKNGKVIYLEIDTKSVVNRLKNAKQKRPLLSDLSEGDLYKKIDKLQNKRKAYYEQAHITLSSLGIKKVKIEDLNLLNNELSS